jgi:hypothetical protein
MATLQETYRDVLLSEISALTAANVKMTYFRDAATCSVVEVDMFTAYVLTTVHV